jgi:ABC-type nitrate/sulfonate/bicarbonate transport system permease component
MKDRSGWRVLERWLPPLGLLAMLVLAWQIYVVAAGVPDYLVPAPSEIGQTLLNERDLLAQNAVPTVQIAIAGYLLAIVLGLAIAIAIHSLRLLEIAVYPIIIASQTVPIIGLAPILVIVLGFTVLPELVIVCLICFFPITVNAVDGFKSVDPDLIDLLRSMGAGRWRTFREVQWPAALPSIFSGLRVAVTFAVVGAIFGEWAGSSEGLGWLLTQDRAQFDTAGAFAVMVLLSVLGIALFVLISLIERVCLPWYHDERRRDALLGRGK